MHPHPLTEYAVERFQYLHGGGTSGHDPASMTELLNARAKEGWYLQHTLPLGAFVLMVFCRANDDEVHPGSH